MESNESISMAIKVRLMRLGKKQFEVAGEAGIDPTTLSGYINGKTDWTIAVLEAIAKPLKFMSVAELNKAAIEERKKQNEIKSFEVTA